MELARKIMEWLWPAVFVFGAGVALLGAWVVFKLGRARFKDPKEHPTAGDTWFAVAILGVSFLFMTGSTWGSISLTKDGLEFTKEAVEEAIEATESAVASDALTRAQLEALINSLQAGNAIPPATAQGLRVKLSQANDSSKATLARLQSAKAFLGPAYGGSRTSPRRTDR